MKNLVSEILERFPTHASMASGIQQAIDCGEPAAFKAVLQGEFSKVGRRWAKMMGGKVLSSLSAWQLSESPCEIAPFLNKLSGRNAALKTKDVSKLVERLANAPAGTCRQRLAMTLITAELIVRFTDSISADDLVLLVDRLANVDCGDFHAELIRDCSTEETPISHLLACGELALALSLLLEPLTDTQKLLDSAQDCLSSTLRTSIDSDGRPFGPIARNLEDYIGCWTRSITLSQAFKVAWPDERTARDWKRLVKNAVTQLTLDGFANQRPLRSPKGVFQLMQTAISLSTIRPDSDTLQSFRRLSRSSPSRQPDPISPSKQRSWQSDAACTALLRNEISQGSDLISIHWDQPDHNLSLFANGNRLLHGRWSSQVVMDSCDQINVSQWDCTCWFQDHEVAFVELQSVGDTGLRHVRQVLLALTEQFALLTESVTTDIPDIDLQLRSEVIAPNPLTCVTNAVTRDVRLKGAEMDVRVVPVWLADDRLHNTDGSLGWNDGRLVSQAMGSGGLCMPILLDWNPRRAHRDADWNRVTVTEQREVLLLDQAAAFRVRVGTLQLLIYRSLQFRKALRCVLGLHTAHETEIGRVQNSGRIAPIVTVESED